MVRVPLKKELESCGFLRLLPSTHTTPRDGDSIALSQSKVRSQPHRLNTCEDKG